MVRSKPLLAMVLLCVLLGTGSAAAQAPKYSSSGDKALIKAFNGGDWKPAVAAFESATRGARGKNWCMDAFFLGYSRWANKQLPEAISIFDDLFKNAETLNCATYGLLPAWHWYRGRVLYDNEQYKEAAASFAEAASLAPTTIPADFWPEWWFRSIGKDKERCYQWRGMAEMSRGAYQESADAFRKAIELNPQNGPYYSQLARAQTFLKQYDEALAAAKRGIALAPDCYAYAMLGNVHAARNQYDDAIVAYRQAIEKDPKVTDVYGLLGNTLAAKGDLDGATATYTKAAELDPANPGIPGAIGAVHVYAGRFDLAIASLSKAIGLVASGSKIAAPYYGSRGLCARETGDREGAVKDAEMAYSLDPKDGTACLALAAVNIDRGKYEEAIALLSPLTDDPFARLLEATAFAKKGDAKRAVEIYTNIPERELLVNRPMRQNARKVILDALRGHVQQRLDQARASESAGRFVEAMTSYSDAMKVADDTTAGLIRQRVAITLKSHPALAELPEEARKYALRGDVLIKEGGFENALAEYRTAVKIAPFNAQLHFNLALIHGQLKNYRQAVASMNVYLQLNPDAPNARAAKDEIYKWEFALEKEGKK